eukprot:TRINITY_DN510_c1_g1_i1.p1 TRINITY_DN510_c1_g1~~TRINITY_DN510_c1_g1_i1.p1  ORF type:complete len:744 (+),score=255.88 TRINITY_DN510_c1_g1_i1:151-2232(+)
MGLIEYERTFNLFVQGMKATSLGAALRKITAEKWAVLVPLTARMEELGLSQISHEFLRTHTLLFDAREEGAEGPETFVTLNGLKGRFAKSGDAMTEIVIDLPSEEAAAEVAPTPLGPAKVDDTPATPVENPIAPSPTPAQQANAGASPVMDAAAAIDDILTAAAPSHTDPAAADATADADVAPSGESDAAASGPAEAAANAPPPPPPPTQSIQIIRETEIEIDATDGFTVPIYLVSDAVRAVWVTNDPIETTGWCGDQPTQEPRDLAGNGAPISADAPAAPPAAAAAPPEQRFRYHNFQEQLCKHAPDIKRKIKMFIADVNKGVAETSVVGARVQLSEDGMPDVVRGFLEAMFEEVQFNPKSPWRNGTPTDLDFAQEGLEKCVLSKIYKKIFGMADELEQDALLDDRLATFKNVDPQTLEVPPAVLEHPTWEEAVKELQKVNNYKCARDKLIAITNCCKLIMNVLRALDPGRAMSADDFLPCLILLVCKAGVKHLFSNTAFIEKYRNPSKMTSEAGYYFCTLQSAIHYLQTVEETSMCFTPEDLERMNTELATKDQPDFNDLNVEEEEGDQGGDEENAEARDLLLTSVTPDPTGPATPAPGDFLGEHASPGAVKARSDALKADVTTLLRSTTPENAALLNRDLKAADLKDLCVEYKRLATLYTSLLELLHDRTGGAPPYPTAPAAVRPASAQS